MGKIRISEKKKRKRFHEVLKLEFAVKVTVYNKNGKFTIYIFFHRNKRFLGIF